jgi:hypothetical protein
MWADGRPDPAFTELLGRNFAAAEAHTIEFPNPITDDRSRGTVYVAVSAQGPPRPQP